MNTSHGWIKLYRCILDDAVCQKSAYFHLWVVLLLRAAHKEHDFIFNNEIHTLKPGQLITGRRKLSKITGIHQSSIDRILKCLENAHMIEQNVLKKYRVITIVKWEFYQVRPMDETTGEPMMSQSRTDGEPIVSTYKNDKNEKNEKTHRRDNFYLSAEEREIKRADEAFERAKAEFLSGSGPVSSPIVQPLSRPSGGGTFGPADDD